MADTDTSEPNESATPSRLSVKVSDAVLEQLKQAAARLGAPTLEDVIAFLLKSHDDRSGTAYMVEQTEMVLVLNALVIRTEQLVLSNYALAETLAALGGEAAVRAMQMCDVTTRQLKEFQADSALKTR